MKMQLRGLLSQGFCAVVALLLIVGTAQAQTPRVLYTWDGTGDQRGWGPAFGDQNQVIYDNNIAGVFRFSENAGHNGTSYAVADHANRLDDQVAADMGGLDLYGLDAIEFDLGMNNSDTTGVNVAFYVQASAGFNFINIPDILVPDTNFGLNTYSFPLNLLTDAQKAHIRIIGLEVRAHTGNASFRLAEVRSVGTPDSTRIIASHNGGSFENGFNGGRINFDQAAVAGNDGSANQTGLSVVDGALTWTDLGGGPGAAISYQNGQWPWAGNDFESRPHDNTNYNYAVFRVRATDLNGNVGTTVNIQGFTQTGQGYNYNVMGPDQTLDIDGEWHTMVFPLAGIPNRQYTMNTSLNLQGHANDIKFEISSFVYTTNLVPEPTSLMMGGLALVCCAGCRRRG
jgi:hypothetical protein